MLAGGKRLSAEEALLLFQPEVRLHRLGLWAFEDRKRRWGDRTFYTVNSHLNPTNACIYRCPICAFYRPAGHPEEETLEFEEILAAAEDAWNSGCTEIHIVGGLHPEKPYSWYREIVRLIHEAFPRLAIKAWSAVEIAHFAPDYGAIHGHHSRRLTGDRAELSTRGGRGNIRLGDSPKDRFGQGR